MYKRQVYILDSKLCNVKINLIHNFLRVLVLRNKKLDNRVWIMFEDNVIQ